MFLFSFILLLLQIFIFFNNTICLVAFFLTSTLLFFSFIHSFNSRFSCFLCVSFLFFSSSFVQQSYLLLSFFFSFLYSFNIRFSCFLSSCLFLFFTLSIFILVAFFLPISFLFLFIFGLSCLLLRISLPSITSSMGSAWTSFIPLYASSNVHTSDPPCYSHCSKATIFPLYFISKK